MTNIFVPMPRRTAWVALWATLMTAVSAGAQPPGAPQAAADWQVPDVDKLPDDKYGQSVRQGKLLMEQTYKYLGPEARDPAKRYAGNNLACVACHVASGTRKFGNP